MRTPVHIPRPFMAASPAALSVLVALGCFAQVF
jgi:hypothetical protein